MTEMCETTSHRVIALWLTAVRSEIFSLTQINTLSAAPTFITTYLWSSIIDNICSDHTVESETA